MYYCTYLNTTTSRDIYNVTQCNKWISWKYRDNVCIQTSMY